MRRPLAHYRPLPEAEIRTLALEASALYPDDENAANAYKFRRMFGRDRLRSPRAFLEGFCWIKDVSGRLRPFILNQSQRYVLAQLLRRGRRGECWCSRSTGAVVFRREGMGWREEETGRVFHEVPKVQRASLKRELGPIMAIILKARQLGISTLVQGLIFEAQVRGDNISAKLVSSLEQSAREVYEMQSRFIDTFSGEMVTGVVRPRILLPTKSRSESGLAIQFGAPLGGKLTCDSAQAKADPGRGGTYQVCHFTEVGEWPRDRETLVALDQVLHIVPGTMKVIESTARGARGAFYVDWKAAESGMSDYVPIFLPWYMRPDSWDFRLSEIERAQLQKDLDNPRFGDYREESFLTAQRYFRPGKGWVKVDLDQLAWRRWWITNKCGGQVDLFHQEYPAFPEEAFLSTGRPVFDQRLCAERIKEIEKAPRNWRFRGDLKPIDWRFILGYHDVDRYFQENTQPALEADDLGPLIIWEDPMPGEEYVMACDVAEGVQGGDHCAISIGTASTGQIVAAYRALTDPITLARIAFRLGWWYNRALLAVEKNNHGYTVLVHLLDPLQYPNVYRRMQRDVIGQPTVDQFGWVTNPTTRKQMFHTFRAWFKENPKRIPWLRLLSEMQQMRYDDAGREDHPDRDALGDKAFDDCVFAQAMLLAVREEAERNKWFTEPEKKPTTDEEIELDEFERLVADRQISLPSPR